MKECKKCKETKSLTSFNKTKRNKDGLQNDCRSCCKAYKAKHYKENKAKINAKNLKWSRDNKDKSNAIKAKYSKANPNRVLETKRKSHAMNKYGLTLEEYYAHLETPCDICGEEAKHLDHCHDSGKVRGGLCRACNIAIGLMKDNTNTMRSAIKYLEDSCTQKNT